ncbi:translocon-associated protein subunit beta [Artemisia annua]|uniref:Translocon-associated protein subunit beta n=1 Tax=Artemisia annua TaxID=35608 RepID=A0A2U1QJZ9_ARTAN|nr:translocon-associated protein subunit beta [Artemisia annua]
MEPPPNGPVVRPSSQEGPHMMLVSPMMAGRSPKIFFSIISGNTSTSWEKLDVTPAVITFLAPNKAALLEAYTTSLLPLEILSDKPQENQLDLDCIAISCKTDSFYVFECAEADREVWLINIRNFYGGSIYLPAGNLT